MITILLALATVAAEPGKKNDTAASDPVTTAATSTAPAPSADNPARRYCVSETFTGSRMAKKMCRTRQEWQQRGVQLR